MKQMTLCFQLWIILLRSGKVVNDFEELTFL